VGTKIRGVKTGGIKVTNIKTVTSATRAQQKNPGGKKRHPAGEGRGNTGGKRCSGRIKGSRHGGSRRWKTEGGCDDFPPHTKGSCPGEKRNSGRGKLRVRRCRSKHLRFSKRGGGFGAKNKKAGEEGEPAQKTPVQDYAGQKHTVSPEKGKVLQRKALPNTNGESRFARSGRSLGSGNLVQRLGM